MFPLTTPFPSCYLSLCGRALTAAWGGKKRNREYSCTRTHTTRRDSGEKKLVCRGAPLVVEGRNFTDRIPIGERKGAAWTFSDEGDEELGSYLFLNVLL